MDLRETGFEDVDWIYLAQAGFCQHGNKHLDYTRVMEFLDC
jgi:hypothetical protein